MVSARLLGLVLAALLSAATPALAVLPDEVMKDPVEEARARALSEQLRCLVCQNQSIDASDAQLARDLRILVRERIAAGDTDQQVLDFLVARYGEFVLLKPRLDWNNLLLWAVPPGALILGGVAVFIARRRSGSRDLESDLSRDEQAKLERLLDEPDV
ncbi:Cytochrome c-type biogenesis protein CcmH precursor [Hartmannibacter diazotrophicus]|uniref:Cytochrome c-type biogenesis protein n=1 Tax=Hartmannibacter diazotrophicus TaxID=1482074 RepID=A0A2C9D3Y6_9HYPH|nr:cytochrome c-type biogenesis protein [Hartmannibacter diazotrophicus]SON54986.1 Cytochrome c-type biogenesis protein CcmH precursor [Hartmannibacter diazotrophicus]